MKNLDVRKVIRRVVSATVETMEQRTLMSAAPISLDASFGNGGAVNGVQTPAGDAIFTVTNPVNGNVFIIGTTPNNDLLIPYEVQQLTSTGSVIKTYGSNGLVTAPVQATADFAAVQPDGKLLVLSDMFTSSQAGRDILITRFTTSGAIDTTFGTNGTLEFFADYAVYNGGLSETFTILPNGDIAMPGAVTNTAANTSASSITAFTSTGKLDTAFGTAGVALGAPGVLEKLAVDASGNLIAVGATGVSSNSPSGAVGSAMIERFTAAGKLDQTFGKLGETVVTNASVFNNIFVSSSSISVFGWLQTETADFVGTISLQLNHFTLSGQVDTTFGSGTGHVAPVLTEYGYTSVFQPDGKLLISLNLDTNGGAAMELVRLNVDGTVDTTFAHAGYNIDGTLGPSLEPDGDIIVAYPEMSKNLDFAARRMLPDGSADTTFGPDGVSLGQPLFGSADAIAELPNGQTLIAGIEYLAGDSAVYIQRYNADGSVDTTFAPGQAYGGTNGYISVGPLSYAIPTVKQLAVDPAGHIYLDEASVGILRFNANGTVDKTFGNNGVPVDPLATGFLLESNGQILENSNSGLVRLNSNGSIDTSFGVAGTVAYPSTFYEVDRNLAVQPDGKILVGGSFDSLTAGSSDLAVLRLNANGSVDTPFGTAGIAVADQLPEEQQLNSLSEYSAVPAGIAVLANGTIVIAGSGGVSGHASFNIGPTVAEFLPTGKLNTGFGQGGQTPAYVTQATSQGTTVGLIVQPDGTLIVAGTQIFGFPPGSNSNLYVIRYTPSGSIDDVFTNQIIPGNPEDIGAADTADGVVAGPNGTVIIAADLVPGSDYQEYLGLARYITDAPLPTGQVTGTVIGSAGSYGGKGNVAANVFDGNLATYFDAKQASGDWVGLDLGSARTITQISFAPRAGWESRMVGGVFQVSSTPNFTSDVHTIYTVTTTPVAGQLMTANVTTGAFRYVRYLGPTGGYCNIAEAQFFAAPSKLTGTAIGTAGSFNNAGNTIANAFDGNLNTFFDASVATGAWVGLDLGSAQVVTQVSFAPRDSGYSGFAKRMVGGEIQASNSADFSSGVVTVYTITTPPPAGVLTTVTLTNSTAYRYWRYIGPANGYCNIAELNFEK